MQDFIKIKKDMVNTDNIRNIASKAPTVDKFLATKDLSIQKASLEQISILNEMFNLKSVGGYKN